MAKARPTTHRSSAGKKLYGFAIGGEVQRHPDVPARHARRLDEEEQGEKTTAAKKAAKKRTRKTAKKAEKKR